MKSLLAALALLFIAGCATANKQALQRFEFEEPQMGVPFRITLYARNQTAAEQAVDAAFDCVRALNAIMSDYEYDSELSVLSRNSGSNQIHKLSRDLEKVLRAAEKFSRASDGAFDITAGPMVTQWRRARRTLQLPMPEQMAKARASFGYTNIIIENHTAQLLAKDMRLDLGAIAKGYASDEALKVLRAHGIRRAIVAASGDMAIGDAPPGKPGWRIALLNAETSPKKFLVLKNCGLATSGDLFQHVDIDGVRYSHIVDPRTGLGLTNQSLVTVIAKDAMTADALSTSISILGPDRGLSLAEKFGAEARHIRTEEEKATAKFWMFAD